MKTNVIKQWTLLLLGTLLCTTIQGQSKEYLFKPRYETAKVKSFRSTFTHSDSITLDGLGTIYALAIDATVTQPHESSFVRVVLEDKEGSQYLVAECDRFRYDEDVVNLERFCQETAILNGIVPVCLRCYTSGDATLSITNIHVADGQLVRGVATKQEQNEIRKAQVQNVVDRINNYNKRHKKLWRARANNNLISPSSLLQRVLYSDNMDSYAANFIYYGGGIYEFGNRDSLAPEPPSNYVDSINWSNFNGKNWLTPVKNQFNTPFCQTLAVVGMTESVAGLYFNDTLNLDLSEQDVASYIYYNNPQWNTLTAPLFYIITNGIIDEDTLPFDSLHNIPTLITPRPIGQELIQFYSYYLCYRGTNDRIFLDDLRKSIVGRGPGAAGLNVYSGHAMLLYGYGKVKPGIYTIYCTDGDEENVVIDSSFVNLLGRTYWKMKNSWGVEWGKNGCADVIFYDYALLPEVAFIDGVIYSSNRDDNDIICEDKDGDGLFYWGLGGIPPTLPTWAPRQKDGDDLDPLRGPLNFYKKPTNIDPNSLPIKYIDNDSTIVANVYVANHLWVRNNSTLKIAGHLVMNKYSQLRLEPGSKLVIEGGSLYNANVCPQEGSAVLITEGGQCISYKNLPFSVPIGATLSILDGLIE